MVVQGEEASMPFLTAAPVYDALSRLLGFVPDDCVKATVKVKGAFDNERNEGSEGVALSSTGRVAVSNRIWAMQMFWLTCVVGG